MSNEYKDWLNDFSSEQRNNYKLCMKYPILIPENYLWETITGDYEYDYTCLDEIPEGWRIAFGESWARDIQAVVDSYYKQVKDTPDAKEIYILQLKEKYGRFTQYFTRYTPELKEVIRKYEELSEKTCVGCGKPAVYRTTGWICPWCEDCIQQISDKYVKI